MLAIVCGYRRVGLSYTPRREVIPVEQAFLIRPYMWRIADVPPDAAAGAFDQILARHRSGEWSSSIELGWGELRLGVPSADARAVPWSLRHVTGMLRSRRGSYRIRVELDLLPWSDSRTELGLRPVRRWPPVLLSPDPYYWHGANALERLVEEMHDLAGAPSAIRSSA